MRARTKTGYHLLSTGTLLFLTSLPFLAGCGGGGDAQGAATTSAVPLALSLSSSTVTVPQGGSIGRVTANITRTNDTASVTLSVSGLPSGGAVTYELQPGTGNTGTIALNPETVAQVTYPLTVIATDGTNTVTQPLSLVINSGTTSLVTSPLAWSATGPLISAIPNATHPIISVKDPSVFYYDNQWNVYATTADSNGNWNMEYINFTAWSNAAAAQPYYMDATPGFSGYHDAPEVFYFTPTNTWYLIQQAPQPQYSTASDPTNPGSWSTPQNFFPSQPASVSGVSWIDFFVVCDSANCYLFFSGDNGCFYRSQTPIGSFPQGMSEPVTVIQDPDTSNIFESGKVYTLQGLNQYLMIIEAMGPDGHRYYRSFIAPSLGGSFTPIPETDAWATPFAGINNFTFNPGVGQWTIDISHGELLRVGYDETMTIDPDPNNLQFLYMGDNPAITSANYELIPWQLGLATRTQ